MSGFRITDEDFYLKQKVRKHSAAAVELLLSHRTYISMFEDLEYHVFLESHGTLHHVWQIVDLGLSRRRKQPITAVDEAAVILGGEKQDPTLVSGRLFNVSGGARSEELTSTIISTLIRARWPYEVVGECLNEGLVSGNRWRAALDAFSAERSRHLDESKRRVAERPQSFRRSTSCSIALSSDRSATSFFSFGRFRATFGEQLASGWKSEARISR